MIATDKIFILDRVFIIHCLLLILLFISRLTLAQNVKIKYYLVAMMISMNSPIIT